MRPTWLTGARSIHDGDQRPGHPPPRALALPDVLVIIGGIVVLGALALCSLRVARSQAYGVRCLDNLRALGSAWYLYQQDNDRRLVGGGVGGRYEGRLLDWVDGPAGNHADELEGKKAGIRRGLLWSYVNEMDVYRCPADKREIERPHWPLRSYSISGNMYGEERSPDRTRRPLKKYSEIRRPADKYAFVEEIDLRGWNRGSWLTDPNGESWIDPVAVWHHMRSGMAFADGRAEMHRWLDKSTMDIAERAATGDTSVFTLSPPTDEGQDLEWMGKRYQLWPSERSEFP